MHHVGLPGLIDQRPRASIEDHRVFVVNGNSYYNMQAVKCLALLGCGRERLTEPRRDERDYPHYESGTPDGNQWQEFLAEEEVMGCEQDDCCQRKRHQQRTLKADIGDRWEIVGAV
jgi:hypothetical protein